MMHLWVTSSMSAFNVRIELQSIHRKSFFVLFFTALLYISGWEQLYCAQFLPALSRIFPITYCRQPWPSLSIASWSISHQYISLALIIKPSLIWNEEWSAHVTIAERSESFICWVYFLYAMPSNPLQTPTKKPLLLWLLWIKRQCAAARVRKINISCMAMLSRTCQV